MERSGTSYEEIGHVKVVKPLGGIRHVFLFDSRFMRVY